MCGCGRNRRTEVVTSAQVQAQHDADAAQQVMERADATEIMIASASAAVRNAHSGHRAHR